MYSQAIKAGDNLILPVNPPRSAAPLTEVDIRQRAEILVKLDETRSELKSALDSGLANDHPKVKSLFALLAVLQGQMNVPGAPKRDSDEFTQLRIHIEVQRQKAEKNNEALLKKLAEMKSEIAGLREEVSELQKAKK